MSDCTPEELKKRIDAGRPPILLDVRQPEEIAIAAIPGAMAIPMGEVPARLMNIDIHMEEEIVVLCHHGMRSASVVGFLRSHGFEKVRNLVGGIDAYSLSADPSIPRY